MPKYPKPYKFIPKNKEKYKGNIDTIIVRSSWEKEVMIWLDTHSKVKSWVSEELVIPYISPVDNRRHRYFPDFLACIEENGVALCAMHHKLFDRGAFSISTEMKIMVSDEANGSLGFNEWLMSFHRKDIRRPQRATSYPKEEFISWHIREVFRGEYRN